MTTRQALDGLPASVRRPKDRKAQIALAAAELFCVRGYAGVGIDEIAQAVGITGPAVYRHFPNKYAILAHATRELTDAVLVATIPVDAGPTERDRLDTILAQLARLGVDRRRVGGLYQWEGRHLEQADRDRLGAAVRTLVDRVALPLSILRPELTPAQASLVARGVLSVMGSLSTHRAVIGSARAVELLRATGWQLLDAPLAPGSPPAQAPSDAGTDPPSRREAIMAEAVHLFHRYGYHAVTMEDIATAAGTKASSLYRHFAGKGELLAAIYHRAADRVALSTAAALSAATGPRDALRRLADSYVDLVFRQTELVAVYRLENANLPEADRHELRKAQRLHVEEWVRMVAPLHPELSTSCSRVLAHAALNLINDLGRQARFDRGTGIDRVIAAMALCLLGAA